MALHRGFDGAEPVRPERVGDVAGARQRRLVVRSTRLAGGTLACPDCDAPVAPSGRMRPHETLACPYCGHGGAVRDFLALGPPSRPARVEVRVEGA